jgi:hypothetical protein
MAESIIAELIRCQGPCRGLDAFELATLEWVERLFEAIGAIAPAEAEANHYRTTPPSESLRLVKPSLY